MTDGPSRPPDIRHMNLSSGFEHNWTMNKEALSRSYSASALGSSVYLCGAVARPPGTGSCNMRTVPYFSPRGKNIALRIIVERNDHLFGFFPDGISVRVGLARSTSSEMSAWLYIFSVGLNEGSVEGQCFRLQILQRRKPTRCIERADLHD